MESNVTHKSLLYSFLRLLLDLAIVYFAFFLCRIIFFACNINLYSGHLSSELILSVLKGGLVFDTSAIIYLNLLFIILSLLPLHIKENSIGYKLAVKLAFVLPNSLGVVANLVDCAYFSFTGRRTTATVFSEFQHEDNIADVFFTEMIHSWYLVLAAILFVFLFWKVYLSPLPASVEKKPVYYTWRVVQLILSIVLCLGGMRGGIDRQTRPITLSNANQYINRPIEAGLVLNTPFSIIRTINKKPFVEPKYFDSIADAEKLFNPIHNSNQDSCLFGGKGKNVVVFIIESFAREYIGALNKNLEHGRYAGYTPFTDSLINHSLTFEYSFCNGRKSIDAMPSILSSIPYFVEPFFLTPAALNNLGGLARELKNEGYYSAFFHGAKNGSMGFEAFAKATGFDSYFGRTEFDQEPKYGGESQFDGYWAIWDEPFFQFYAEKMSTFKQPFVTALFSASSHHPFNIPNEYKDIYKEEILPIHKCIRYTDNALRQFFNTARKQPWYSNTLFVICSDHTNQSNHQEYQTDLGVFVGPIIFYSPSDTALVGMSNKIAQQIDVMPTVLSYLNYKKTYICFGCDLLTTPKDETFAVNYSNGIYQYVKYGHILQFDGREVKAVYNLNDSLLVNNLIGKTEVQQKMENELKAIIEQYMMRMNNNKLIIDN